MAKMDAINEDTVRNLPTPKAAEFHWAGGLKLRAKIAPAGFGVRVTPAGTKSFIWRHVHEGKQIIEVIGIWEGCGGPLSVLDAIEKTKQRAEAVDKNRADPRPGRVRMAEQQAEDAKAATPDGIAKRAGKTVTDVIDDFVTRHVEKPDRPLRSAAAIKRSFDRLVKPEIGEIAIRDIERDHITNLLDNIESKNGPVMADRVLAAVRKCFNWYAIRDKHFNTPIVKGMARSELMSRDRVLDHEEMRDLWKALDVVKNVPECFPRYIKFTLLCATRRNESADMHASEIKGDDWIIPASRYKRLPAHRNKDHVIQLSNDAQALIGDGKGYIFSSDGGKTAFAGFSKAKAELDRTINAIRKDDGRDEMPNWTLHDLRRTASTLMAEAGVRPDYAERCLGHVISGVAGTYNRFEYPREKREAFEALASLVRLITNPQPNVVPLHAAECA